MRYWTIPRMSLWLVGFFSSYGAIQTGVFGQWKAFGLFVAVWVFAGVAYVWKPGW